MSYSEAASEFILLFVNSLSLLVKTRAEGHEAGGKRRPEWRCRELVLRLETGLGPG